MSRRHHYIPAVPQPAEQWVEIARVTTVGTSTVSIPSGYSQIGFWIVGGGAGGAGDRSSSQNAGAGGNGGQAVPVVVERSAAAATVVVGGGGAGGTKSTNASTSGAGGASSVTYNGIAHTAAGGLKAANYGYENSKVANSGTGGFGQNGVDANFHAVQRSGKAGEGNGFTYNGVTHSNTRYCNGGDGQPNPFDPNDTNLYGAGGGGGTNAYTASDRAMLSYGGLTGGGNGGYGVAAAANTTNRGAAATFYGGGGGGGAFTAQHTYSQGGAGYQGIVIIYGKV